MNANQQQLYSLLQSSVQTPTIAHHETANDEEIARLLTFLKEMEFTVDVFSDSPYKQPALVAQRTVQNGGGGKLCLYNHYDVEPIHKKNWEVPPFELTPKEGRLFGRGIADNKGVLWARIMTLLELHKRQSPCPALLWLIQGEEEVGPEVAYTPFRAAINDFRATLYLEETGYYTEKGQQFLLNPLDARGEELVVELMNGDVDSYFFEERYLNKSYSQKPCPFISNIPANGIYLSFGPNDSLSRIHNSNESIDQQLLFKHQRQFAKLLDIICKRPD